MQRSMLAAVVAAALVAPFAAYAEAPQNTLKVAAGQARADIDGWGKESDTAFSLSYGMPISETFDVELGYVNFGDVKINDTTTGDALSAKSQAIFIAGIAKAPLGAGFSLFGKLGASYHWSKWTPSISGVPGIEEKDKRLAPLVGVGVSYQLSNEWAADLEFSHFNKVTKQEGVSANLNLLTVGVRYTF